MEMSSVRKIDKQFFAFIFSQVKIDNEKKIRASVLLSYRYDEESTKKIAPQSNISADTISVGVIIICCF